MKVHKLTGPKLIAFQFLLEIVPLSNSLYLFQYVSTEYIQLCNALEPVVSVKDKEDIATCLVHVLEKLGKAKDFLTDVIMAEVSRLGMV